jgi:hypothetical protein
MAEIYQDINYLANEAFNKLASYTYFDRQNLLIRKELALFIQDGKQNRLRELTDGIQAKGPMIKTLIESINLTFLPKSIKENSNLIDPKYLSKRFYTNQVYKDSSLVDRVNIFIDAPLEVHLISAMWVLKYGKYLDEDLG